MSLSIFNRVGLLSKLKNFKVQSSRKYNMHHHMTPIQVDALNNNTMNHLPKPKGSWKELNDKRQAINNATLLVGTALFLSTFLAIKQLNSDSYSSYPKDRMNTEFVGSKF